MPIHFKCETCGTLLKVGRKKIGQAIACPKCTSQVVVPPVDAVSGLAVPPRQPKGLPSAPGDPQGGTARPFDPSAQPLIPDELPDDEESELEELRYPEFVVYDAPEDPTATDRALRSLALAGGVNSPAPAIGAANALPGLGVPSPAPPRPGAAAPLAPPGRPAPGTPLAPPPLVAGGAPVAGTSAVSRGLILLTPAMFWTLILSLLTLSVTLFFVGFLLGAHFSGPVAETGEAGQTGEVGKQVVLEGIVKARGPDDRLAGDRQALVFALPETALPGDPVRPDGFLPDTEGTLERQHAEEALKRRGGALGTCDVDGTYHFLVPGPGKYRLVVISGRRGSVDRGDAADAALALRAFVASPERLLEGRPSRTFDLTADGKYERLGTHVFELRPR